MHVTMGPTQAKNAIWCSWHMSTSLVSLDILLHAALFGRRWYLFSSENGHNLWPCILAYKLVIFYCKFVTEIINQNWISTEGSLEEKKKLWREGSALSLEDQLWPFPYPDKILHFVPSWEKGNTFL